MESELRGAAPSSAGARKDLAEARTRSTRHPRGGTGLRQEDLRALVDAARLARKLADGLAGVADHAGAHGVTDEPPPPPTAAAPDAGNTPVTPRPRVRRLTLQVPPGLVAETPEGIDALLRTPGLAVVLDGYNVSMAAWPSLGTAEQRDRLVAALAQLALRTRAAVTVVFDGADVGAVPTPRRPGVRVVFSSASEKADPVVVREVAAFLSRRPCSWCRRTDGCASTSRPRERSRVSSRAFLATLRG